MKKDSIKLIIAFILGGIFFGAFSVYATIMIVSSNVSYLPRDNEWNVENVEDALDELYDMARNYTGTINFEGISFDYDYTGSVQQLRVPASGEYKIELWGAQGGTNITEGGKGAYTKGVINLEKGKTIYIYVGGNGTDNNGYNGGGTAIAQYPKQDGGGATDVRYFENEPSSNDLAWNSAIGLKNRIMVAAGGGGSSAHTTTAPNLNDGGAAGGLNGYDGKTGICCNTENRNLLINPAGGATQTSGGIAMTCQGGCMHSSANTGSFGKGANDANNTTTYSSGGGGGGYYGGGGGATTHCQITSSAGGSSFISGHDGCDAIDSNGVHTGQPNHYLGLVFSETTMIDGEGYNWTNTRGSKTNQVQPDGTTSVGHSGNGYAKITYIG